MPIERKKEMGSEGVESERVQLKIVINNLIIENH